MTGVLAGTALFLASLLALPAATQPGGRRLRRLGAGPHALRPAPGPAGSRRPGRALSLRRPGPAASAATAPAAVAVLAERVAGLCRAGLAPSRAWGVLAEHDRSGADVCARVARTVAMGGSSAEGLRLASPGGGPVAWLALAVTLAERSGAPLADVLDGLAAVIRDHEQAGRERESALAGPRATAALLSWLPLAGIGLGLLTGVDAIGVLFGTTPGRACLVAGAALWAAGRWWMRRLLRRAARPQRASG